MNNLYPAAVVAVVSLVTILLRFLPFLIFGSGKKTPGFVVYLSKYLPYAIMGMLVVYCLKHVNLFTALHGLPEFFAVTAVILIHLWKRNTLLSIVGGTFLYMGLIQEILPPVWVAAALVISVAVCVVSYIKRTAHYKLWSEAGKRVREQKEAAWEDYPRPQMRREHYLMLNGTWKLNGDKIRIPFPPQAMLSGYEKKVDSLLCYEKEFWIPEDFTKERVLLHFGAVDQIAEVFVNGHMAGCHEGGYLPFSFDITDYVKRDVPNQLLVKAIDELSIDYPYGKQTKKRGGMWYTPVSGIWQSVWLENVPESYIKRMVLKSDLEGVDITLFGEITDFDAEVYLEDGQVLRSHFDSRSGRIQIPNGRFWTPEEPYLYSMTITTKYDKVQTYFALRTIQIKELDGVKRVCLNEKPVFLHGVLDQGYYSDGLYLAANEREYERDILRMKELGINLLRKHIKIEPECFYYYCDKCGMMVMQDMVNNGSYDFIRDTAFPTVGFKKRSDTKADINGRRQQIFLQHTKDTIEHLYNHPCIVAYTIFNEGWGQFCSDEVFRMVKNWDNTRLIDSTSGWFAQEENDFDSEHIYFKVISLHPNDRPLFVSECGGYSMVSKGHHYSKYNTYGYGSCPDSDALTDAIEKMYRSMILPSVKDGVCGCVYTQLSDVEDEVNGLYTYDRAVCKVDKERMIQLAKDLQAEL